MATAGGGRRGRCRRVLYQKLAGAQRIEELEEEVREKYHSRSCPIDDVDGEDYELRS